MNRRGCLLAGLLLVVATTLADPVRLVSLDYPPYQFKNPETGQVEGYIADLVRESFRRMGFDSRVDIHAWPRSLLMVREGEADAVFTAYRTAEREQFLRYNQVPLVEQEIVFYVANDADIRYEGHPASLAPYRIGIVRDISYGPIMDALLANETFPNLEVSTHLEQSVRKFHAGRFDILLSNKDNIEAKLARLGVLDQYRQLGNAVETLPSYIAFTQQHDNQALIDAFDRTWQRLIEDGTYELIRARYLGY